MKVILQQDVKSLGKKGQLVEVSDGYARNYLMPRKLAAPATAAAMNEYTQQEAAKKFKAQKELEEAKELAEKLSGVTVKLTARGGSQGKLFGSVTTKEVSERLKAQIGIEVDRKKLVMEDIKNFGTVEAECRIHQGISAKFYVLVAAEE
ncbi:50S ribosomal protein L9 [bioreactor metagenome]|uniref:50S ribosomal protein L9 n=1 Tax=bioreactor metagenome TaxID=1076179 RepID=A0A644XC23_9ZZZZ